MEKSQNSLNFENDESTTHDFTYLTKYIGNSYEKQIFMAGGGGLIRDGNGTWLIGFARKIGTATSFLAELWALQDGLRLCLQIQAQAVCIELDAKAVVDALHSQSYTNTVIYSIMEDCNHLVTLIPQTSVRHVYREANRCADFLSKLGTGLENDFAIFSSPPMDLLAILEDDVCGFSINRLCPVVLAAG